MMPSSVIGSSRSGCSLQLCTVLRIGHFIEPFLACYSCPLFLYCVRLSRARPLQNAYSRESSWCIFLIFVLDSPCDSMEIRGKVFSGYFRSPLPFSFPPLPALRAIRAPPASRRRPFTTHTPASSSVRPQWTSPYRRVRTPMAGRWGVLVAAFRGGRIFFRLFLLSILARLATDPGAAGPASGCAHRPRGQRCRAARLAPSCISVRNMLKNVAPPGSSRNRIVSLILRTVRNTIFEKSYCIFWKLITQCFFFMLFCALEQTRIERNGCSWCYLCRAINCSLQMLEARLRAVGSAGVRGQETRQNLKRRETSETQSTVGPFQRSDQYYQKSLFAAPVAAKCM